VTPPAGRQQVSRNAVVLAAAAALLAAPLAGQAQSPPASSDGMKDTPPPSTSSPSHEPRAAAQALFEEAMNLRKRNAWPEVCAKLEESLRLDPAPGAKFYLAECLEQTGKLASAWLLYTEVADIMANTGQQKREAAARERAAALSPRIARLQVVVPAAARVPGLVVRRDGAVVGEAQWGFATPVDLGAHTIEATAPDRVPFTRSVDLREPGNTVTVELPPWTAVATAPVVVPPPPPPPPPFPLRTAGIVLVGLGLAGGAAGAALGSVALSKQAESNRGPCDPARDVCTPQGISLRADALTAATGSTVTFVAAGVLFAAGVVLVLWPTSAKPASPPAAALTLHPNGLSLEGRW
jgi:hypothetical protein